MRRGRAKRLSLIALCTCLAVLFAGLGVWQVERLGWKRDLIARVDARLAAPPVDLASRRSWPEYTKVRTSGRFDHGRETLVDALTERGKGYWVLTPLVTRGPIVLVNRGFVPSGLADPSARRQGLVSGDVRVSGLIRFSEPEGRFLRANQPAADRWYSRDVQAIAAARGLGQAAPFFIDADAAPNPGGYPVGGLTVVSFRNAHLVYALTWFGLAGLCLIGLVLTLRSAQNGA